MINDSLRYCLLDAVVCNKRQINIDISLNTTYSEEYKRKRMEENNIATERLVNAIIKACEESRRSK